MVKVPVDKIIIPDVRASSRFTPEQLEFFQATIKEFGVAQDPVVRDLGDGTYELMAGKSRMQELVRLGAKEIDVKVMNVDRRTGLFLHLAENVGRGTVDPVSVAKVVRELMADGTTVSEIAHNLGKSETYVRRALALLELPEVWQKEIAEGHLTPGHVFAAAKLTTPNEIESALITARDLGWSVSILETYVANRLEEIELARQKAAQLGVEPEIPTPEPERLIQYKQCYLCGYRAPSDKVLVTLACEDCQNLVKYLVGQLGSPSEAMEIVFNALKRYYGSAMAVPKPEQGPTSDAAQQ